MRRDGVVGEGGRGEAQRKRETDCRASAKPLTPALSPLAARGKAPALAHLRVFSATA